MEGLRVDARVARELNQAMVFDLVRARRIVSRTGLVRETGLSKATVSDIVDHFLHEGFVRDLGPDESTGGRRPMLLEFDPRARLTMGVELGATSCCAVLTDLNANPIRSRAASIRAVSAEDALATATALIAEVMADVPPGILLGIGVGTPGVVDSESGTIRMAHDLGWRDVPVGSIVAERFGSRVAVVNRAKAAALGEAWCGAGQDVDNLVYVSLSTGIAAGIVVGRRLYQGVSMSDGELGHVTVLPNGPLCRCGNRGCLEALAAGPAVVARIREELRAGHASALAESNSDLLTLETIADAARGDDPLVLDVLSEVAEYVGIATANVINVLNPGMLILGGGVIRALPALVPLIQRVVRRRTMPVPFGAVQVVPSHLGAEAVPVGAAAFLLSQVSVVGSARVRPVVVRA
ncbi:MAG: ROK family protein [Chloroflexi bacterium]|nr:ROK family protein [Chloroflexota bacterium]